MTPAIVAFIVLLLIGAPVAVVMALSGVAGEACRIDVDDFS